MTCFCLFFVFLKGHAWYNFFPPTRWVTKALHQFAPTPPSNLTTHRGPNSKKVRPLFRQDNPEFRCGKRSDLSINGLNLIGCFVFSGDNVFGEWLPLWNMLHLRCSLSAFKEPSYKPAVLRYFFLKKQRTLVPPTNHLKPPILPWRQQVVHSHGFGNCLTRLLKSPQAKKKNFGSHDMQKAA